MTSRRRPQARSARRRFARAGLWLLVWFGMALLITSIGLRLFFGKITLDQLRFNIIALRVDGGGGAIVLLGLTGILVVPAILTWLLARLHAWPPKRPNARISPLKITVLGIAASVILVGSTAFVSTVKLSDYMPSADETLDIGDFYRAPTIEPPQDPHNLILIYLESAEDALGDDSLFADDMLAPVKRATRGWQTIDTLRQYSGGGWTMARLVATQCGLPLFRQTVLS